ncbi:hypothetical protein [Pseudopedobacter beijingensis]|uniref:Lipocalin-like domain-containing protein n=1 Tax=Pseudopedobacter beijingensis TaxID=1207056 RepID=A0ABW4IE62_9SPHI
MKNLRNVLLILGLMVSLSACNKQLDKGKLIGKWNYIKVEYLREDPPVVQEGKELEEKHPYLLLSADGNASIFSEDKIISEGKYHIEGDIVRYEEMLEGNIRRKIPFLIKTLDEKNLIFETMDKNTIRITAVKD